MRIGIDLDGCGHDFVDGVRQYAHQKLGIPLETMPDAEVWDFPVHQWGWTWAEFKERCDDGVDCGIIFRLGEPEEGFVETLTRFCEDGHTIHIATDRSFGTRSIHNTIDWLQEFGVPYDTLTFTADKTLLNVDIFIEDRDKNYEALRKVEVDCYLFDRPWNAHVEAGTSRIQSWQEFYESATAWDAYNKSDWIVC